MKYAWSSKTIWLNVILLVLVLFGMGNSTIFGIVAGIGNIYLRFKTNSSITMKKEKG